MPKIKAIRGVLATFWRMTKEDFMAMDHKLVRIAMGVFSFLLMAFVWYFFLRKISPFGF